MKFKYDDEVEIINGFYTGLTGKIKNYNKLTNKYLISLYVKNFATDLTWCNIDKEIFEHNLKFIKERIY